MSRLLGGSPFMRHYPVAAAASCSAEQTRGAKSDGQRLQAEVERFTPARQQTIERVWPMVASVRQGAVPLVEYVTAALQADSGSPVTLARSLLQLTPSPTGYTDANYLRDYINPQKAPEDVWRLIYANCDNATLASLGATSRPLQQIIVQELKQRMPDLNFSLPTFFGRGQSLGATGSSRIKAYAAVAEFARLAQKTSCPRILILTQTGAESRWLDEGLEDLAPNCVLFMHLFSFVRAPKKYAALIFDAEGYPTLAGNY